MRMLIVIWAWAGVVRLIAGEFINLDFDMVRTDRLTPISKNYSLGAIDDLLPGWSVARGFPYKEQSSIVYSKDPISIAADSGVGVAPSVGGNGFTIMLNPEGFTTGVVPVKMWQTAMVPIWAKRLEFDGLSNSAVVSVNDEVTYVLAQEHVLDVSQYAGSTVTLALSSSAGSFRLDGMKFTAVPEPSVGILSFATIGGMMIFWIVRKSVSAR